jgi:Holliday junction resolvase
VASKSKSKGNTYERELVDQLAKEGYDVKRAWGSDGRSMGFTEDVDILAKKSGKTYKIQAKRRKSIPKWLAFGNCDLVMTREDRGETIVLVKLDDWLNLVK